MGILTNNPVEKVDEATLNTKKLLNDETKRMKVKQDYLNQIMEIANEFRDIHESMSDYRQELYKLVTDQILSCRFTQLEEFTKQIEAEVEGLSAKK